MASPDTAALPRPPAPAPRARRLGPLGTMWMLRKNPIETWTKFHFEEPIIVGSTILGTIAVVSEPAAIRAFPRRQRHQLRQGPAAKTQVLGEGLRDGLLLAEGDAWRVQRRTLAPLFAPKTVAGFATATNDAALELVARWMRLREGRVFDIQPEMARRDARCAWPHVFSDGLGREPGAFTGALTRYFLTLGRLDPFDLLNFPEWVPRLTKLNRRRRAEFFRGCRRQSRRAAQELLAANKAAAPRDILTLLIEAEDPQTGAGLSAAEVRANIVTFIGAGHETTANALIWSLFLLSLSEEWRARLAAEADRVLPGPVEVLCRAAG